MNLQGYLNCGDNDSSIWDRVFTLPELRRIWSTNTYLLNCESKRGFKPFFLLFCFEIGSHYGAQAGLELHLLSQT
jgi:hypothetical protein